MNAVINKLLELCTPPADDVNSKFANSLLPLNRTIELNLIRINCSAAGKRLFTFQNRFSDALRMKANDCLSLQSNLIVFDQRWVIAAYLIKCNN